jgi:hypothetical protein
MVMYSRIVSKTSTQKFAFSKLRYSEKVNNLVLDLLIPLHPKTPYIQWVNSAGQNKQLFKHIHILWGWYCKSAKTK